MSKTFLTRLTDILVYQAFSKQQKTTTNNYKSSKKMKDGQKDTVPIVN